ncbi:hypothetical protein Q4610_12520, partial [Sphingobium sp. HBC34]
ARKAGFLRSTANKNITAKKAPTQTQQGFAPGPAKQHPLDTGTSRFLHAAVKKRAGKSPAQKGITAADPSP